MRGPFNWRASSSKSASLRSEIAGPSIAGTSIPLERPISCRRAMMAAATAHPRSLACALGSIETSGSNTFICEQCRALRPDCA
jgi:hypothetical protein